MKPWHKHAAVALVAAASTFAATKLTAPVPPSPPILQLPIALETEPGKQLKIEATTTATVVRWLAPSHCDLTPSETGHYAVFSSLLRGKYNVAAWTVKDGQPTKPVICEVEVKEASPAPGPGPGPAPGPGPGALVVKLQAAYLLDKQPPQSRAEQKILLTGIYQALAVKAQDKSVRSTSELMVQLRAAITGLMKTDSLVEVRALVANEAKLQFGESPAVLDDALRSRLAAFWQGMAEALKLVK